jgi:hypothetical protein
MLERLCSPDLRPRFVELLCGGDADEYYRLRQYFSHSTLSIPAILSALRRFCVHNDDTDRNRFLACGVCWLSGDHIAFSLRTLLPLIDKSKSAFKGALNKLGYVAVPNFSCELLNRMPVLENNPGLLREWCIYSSRTMTPVPEMPDLDGLTAMEFAASPVPEPIYQVMSSADLRKKEMKDKLQEFFDDPFCCTPNCLFDEFQIHVCP